MLTLPPIPSPLKPEQLVYRSYYMSLRSSLVSESADENEESIADAGRFFDSAAASDADVARDLAMTTRTMPRSSLGGAGRGSRPNPAVGFLRGIGRGGGQHHQHHHQQHVTFDPEAPPLTPSPHQPHHQTTCLLEKPEGNKKVKVKRSWKLFRLESGSEKLVWNNSPETLYTEKKI